MNAPSMPNYRELLSRGDPEPRDKLGALSLSKRPGERPPNQSNYAAKSASISVNLRFLPKEISRRRGANQAIGVPRAFFYSTPRRC
jgi:hypothetical protein